jgi:hypothetical protein
MREDEQMDEYGKRLNAMVAEAVEKRAKAIDKACELAMQSGTMGVLVVDEMFGASFAVPHPVVPFGMIHIHRVTSAHTRTMGVDEWQRKC